MDHRIRACTALVAAAVSSLALGQTTPSDTAAAAQAAPPASAPAAPPPKPLMSLLDAAGIGKPLEDAGINIFGFIEGGYTYNALVPANGINVGRVFDFENEQLLLNQWDLTVQRTVDPTKNAPDIGFTAEMVYGSDSRIIHANGLDFYGPGDAVIGPQLDPENQFDLVQAYVDVVPFKNVMVRAGKFAAPVGYETINPTTTPFYSRSYLFGFAAPFTQTGALVYWNATDKLTLMGGFTRGWDVALEDYNSTLDGVGQVKYALTDKLTSVVTLIIGPEKLDNNNDCRTLIDLVVNYGVTDQFALGANADWGYEEGDTASGGGAQWYGLALYAAYKVNDPLALNFRGEWFNDDNDARGLGTTVYEATAGVTVTPFPSDDLGQNLKIRPEVRWDYAENAIFDGQNSQFTVGIDAYFTY